MWPLKNVTCCPGDQASVSCTLVRVWINPCFGSFSRSLAFPRAGRDIYNNNKKKKKTETDAARRELMAELSHY